MTSPETNKTIFVPTLFRNQPMNIEENAPPNGITATTKEKEKSLTTNFLLFIEIRNGPATADQDSRIPKENAPPFAEINTI